MAPCQPAAGRKVNNPSTFRSLCDSIVAPFVPPSVQQNPQQSIAGNGAATMPSSAGGAGPSAGSAGPSAGSAGPFAGSAGLSAQGAKSRNMKPGNNTKPSIVKSPLYNNFRPKDARVPSTFNTLNGKKIPTGPKAIQSQPAPAMGSPEPMDETADGLGVSDASEPDIPKGESGDAEPDNEATEPIDIDNEYSGTDIRNKAARSRKIKQVHEPEYSMPKRHCTLGPRHHPRERFIDEHYDVDDEYVRRTQYQRQLTPADLVHISQVYFRLCNANVARFKAIYPNDVGKLLNARRFLSIILEAKDRGDPGVPLTEWGLFSLFYVVEHEVPYSNRDTRRLKRLSRHFNDLQALVVGFRTTSRSSANLAPAQEAAEPQNGRVIEVHGSGRKCHGSPLESSGSQFTAHAPSTASSNAPVEMLPTAPEMPAVAPGVPAQLPTQIPASVPAGVSAGAIPDAATQAPINGLGEASPKLPPMSSLEHTSEPDTEVAFDFSPASDIPATVSNETSAKAPAVATITASVVTPPVTPIATPTVAPVAVGILPPVAAPTPATAEPPVEVPIQTPVEIPVEAPVEITYDPPPMATLYVSPEKAVDRVLHDEEDEMTEKLPMVSLKELQDSWEQSHKSSPEQPQNAPAEQAQEASAEQAQEVSLDTPSGEDLTPSEDENNEPLQEGNDKTENEEPGQASSWLHVANKYFGLVCVVGMFWPRFLC